VGIPSLRNFKFVRVCSLVGRYFYNMYIVTKMKLCLPLMLRTPKYVHVNIILDFPITYYRNGCFALSIRMPMPT